MRSFSEFVDRKEREAKRHLEIIGRLLESQGLKVNSHLKDDEPYIFVFTPKEQQLSFAGVRIYQIGSQIAYRIQKQEKTHPFGRAYSLDVEEMYNDLLEDHHKPEEAGKEVIKSVVEEVKKFFTRNVKAEKDLRTAEIIPSDPFAAAGVIRPNMIDYGNMIFSRG